jgi:hypothetical protein
VCFVFVSEDRCLVGAEILLQKSSMLTDVADFSFHVILQRPLIRLLNVYSCCVNAYNNTTMTWFAGGAIGVSHIVRCSTPHRLTTDIIHLS